jgi:SAM-dependent methyltransferase
MPDDPDVIRAAIAQRFAGVALAPEQETRFPVGLASARRLGYGAAELEGLPATASASFCGVGNPFALGLPCPGQTVLDLGCGAGLDCLLAAWHVGSTGRVIGVDRSPEMIARANHTTQALGLTQVEVMPGEIDRLPLPDASVDLVLSNGVFNLCLDKPAVLAEVVRVLRPGGRLQMADILVHAEVSPEAVAQLGTWSD